MAADNRHFRGAPGTHARRWRLTHTAAYEAQFKWGVRDGATSDGPDRGGGFAGVLPARHGLVRRFTKRGEQSGAGIVSRARLSDEPVHVFAAGRLDRRRTVYARRRLAASG